MLRVLFLSNEFPRPAASGKASFNLEMVRALAEICEVRVVSPVSWLEQLRRTGGRTVGASVTDTLPATVQVEYPRYFYTPGVGRSKYGDMMWRSIKSTLLRTVQDFRPDVILSYWLHPDGEVAVRLGRAAGLPVAVMTGGSDVLLLTRNSARKRRIMRVMEHADAVITIGQHLKSEVVGLGIAADKTHFIYRGVDRSRFNVSDQAGARSQLGLAQHCRMLLWVGRLEAVKGLDVLLQACTDLRDRNVDYHLYLVGDGQLKVQFTAQCVAHSICERVTFVGSVAHTELPKWYQAADLTVLPSLSEGIPNVLLEAICCGGRFVASQVGGIPEIADPAYDTLVPAGDAQALASAIERALSATRPLSERIFEPPNSSSAAQPLLSLLTDLAKAQRVPRPVNGVTQASRIRQSFKRILGTLPPRYFMARGPRRSNQVCLTFDDGPHPEITPSLLDLLAELHVKATFFLIGREAERYPAIVKRMVADGHVIGNHTWSHPNPRDLQANELADEVQRTGQVLSGLTGRDSRLFRPPHGKLNMRHMFTLWNCRQTIVLWNSDPRDFACRSANELAQVFREHPPQSGDIVLLHDNQPHSVKVLREVVIDARRRNLSFVTLDEWLPKATRVQSHAH